MNCRDCEILMQMAIDKTLPDKGRGFLLAHVSECPACAAQYQEYLNLDNLLKQHIAAAAPAGFVTEVMSALPVSGTESPPLLLRKTRKYIARISLAAVAAALLLIAGLSGWFTGEAPTLDDPPLPMASVDDPPSVGDPDDRDHTANPNQGESADSDSDTDQSEADSQNDPSGTDEPQDSQTETIENPPTYAGGILLPQVAHSTESHGSYSLYTLATHVDFDAILPRVSGNIVTYYLIANDFYLEWQTKLDRDSEPVFVGETESLPSAASIAGFKDQSMDYGYTHVSAVSKDRTRLAINQGGDEAGLWLYAQNGEDVEPVLADVDGGGSIVSWAPDGNKVLYTRTDGSLHLYYPDQNLLLDLYSGPTSYVCWAADSQNIVFSAMDSETGHLSIFSVIVP